MYDLKFPYFSDKLHFRLIMQLQYVQDKVDLYEMVRHIK